MEEKYREILLDAGRLYLGEDTILYINPFEGVMDEKKTIEGSI